MQGSRHVTGVPVLDGLERKTRAIRRRMWNWFDLIWHRGRRRTELLYAFYDLSVSPVTFDILKFLFLAEIRRKQIGCAGIHVIIVPGEADGFRIDDNTHYDADHKRWRLRNVLMPCCALMPSPCCVTVCGVREEAYALRSSVAGHVFPDRYSVRHPVAHYEDRRLFAAVAGRAEPPVIVARDESMRRMGDWIENVAGGRRVVTISLREANYEPDRNSNLAAWIEFARSLDLSTYCPVFLRDIDRAMDKTPDEFGEFIVCKEAVWNLELRAALYSLSYVNMAVSGGPALVCLLLRDSPCLVFKMVVPSCGASTEHYLRSQGWTIGEQVKWAAPLHRIVWEDDHAEALKKEFQALTRVIDERPSLD